MAQWIRYGCQLFLFLFSCARPQYVLYITTDAPVPGLLYDHPELSPDAAIDTVRVDVLDQHNRIIDLCQFSAADPADWPISLGIVRPSDGSMSRLRIRGFRRRFVHSEMLMNVSRLCGSELTGAEVISISEPPPEVTIERLVELASPPSGVTDVVVHLSLGCMGIPSDYGHGTTCLDETHQAVPAAAGTAPISPNSMRSSLGSSPIALEAPCTRPAPDVTKTEAICIPGGFTIMGNQDVVGLKEPELDPIPYRAVRVSPFYMDKTEFTVERLRALLLRDPTLPQPRKKGYTGLPYSEYCTWENAAPGNLPVNCLRPPEARGLCSGDRGELPSEAQWEHAAGGRGRRYLYPWGRRLHSCCGASLGHSIKSSVAECAGVGAEPVGTHDGTGCPEGGDVSRDGVLDMGGSLQEIMRDRARPYDERCGLPSEGIAKDPFCPSDYEEAQISRGSDWSSGTGTAISAIRTTTNVGPLSGFRCVYPGGP